VRFLKRGWNCRKSYDDAVSRHKHPSHHNPRTHRVFIVGHRELRSWIERKVFTNLFYVDGSCIVNQLRGPIGSFEASYFAHAQPLSSHEPWCEFHWTYSHLSTWNARCKINRFRSHKPDLNLLPLVTCADRSLCHQTTALSTITLSKKQSTSRDTFTDEHLDVKNTPRALVCFRIDDLPDFRLNVSISRCW